MLHGIGVDLLNRETIPDACLEPGVSNFRL